MQSTVLLNNFCPSVGMSNTGVVSKLLYESSDFLPTGASAILVFLSPNGFTKFQANPSHSGDVTRGSGQEKTQPFRPKSPFISETIRDMPIVNMDYIQLISLYRLRIFDNLKWPWKAGCKGPKFFRRISVHTLVPFDLKLPILVW